MRRTRPTLKMEYGEAGIYAELDGVQLGWLNLYYQADVLKMFAEHGLIEPDDFELEPNGKEPALFAQIAGQRVDINIMDPIDIARHFEKAGLLKARIVTIGPDNY